MPRIRLEDGYAPNEVLRNGPFAMFLAKLRMFRIQPSVVAIETDV